MGQRKSRPPIASRLVSLSETGLAICVTSQGEILGCTVPTVTVRANWRIVFRLKEGMCLTLTDRLPLKGEKILCL
jgi:hypothetical protein